MVGILSCLASFTKILILRLLSATACSHMFTHFMAGESIVLCDYHELLTQSTADQHLGCFLSWAIVTQSVMNILMKRLFTDIGTHFSWAYSLELLGYGQQVHVYFHCK